MGGFRFRWRWVHRERGWRLPRLEEWAPLLQALLLPTPLPTPLPMPRWGRSARPRQTATIPVRRWMAAAAAAVAVAVAAAAAGVVGAALLLLLVLMQ
jgi:hypothetical protein